MLTAGGSISAVETDVGNGVNTVAVFNQTGGSHTDAGDLYLAVGVLSTATYLMSGPTATSTLRASQIVVGNSGTASFNQAGGTVTATDGVPFR